MQLVLNGNLLSVGNKIKIIHIINSLNVGGAEESLLKIIEETDENYDHSIITLIPDYALIQNHNRFAGRVSCLFSWSGLTDLIRVICVQRKIILIGWLYASIGVTTIVKFLSVLIGRNKYKIKSIWMIRSGVDYSSQSLVTKSLQKILRIFISNADTVIYNSYSSRDDHKKMLGYSHEKSIVLPNFYKVIGPSTETNKVLSGTLRPPLIFGSLGRWNAIKQKNLFLEVGCLGIKRGLFGTVICCGNENVTLGRKFVDEEPMMSDFSEYFKFFDHMSRENFFGSVDMVFVSSLNESFPNVFFEAFLYGVIPFSFPVGDVGKIPVFSPFVIDFTQDIDRCFGQIFLRFEALQASGFLEFFEAKKFILSNFSKDVFSSKFENIIKGLVESE